MIKISADYHISKFSVYDHWEVYHTTCPGTRADLNVRAAYLYAIVNGTATPRPRICCRCELRINTSDHHKIAFIVESLRT